MKADAFERLREQVVTIVQESGNPEGFEADKWLTKWLSMPIGTLGGKSPAEYLNTEEGVELISNLLGQIQHGLYG
jgi:uncharacterized protein (DUF2384 family)